MEETKEISLDGGESQKIVFIADRESAGVCKVEINGLTGSFVVQEKAPSAAKEEISITPAPIPNWGRISGLMAGAVTAGLVSYFWIRKQGKTNLRMPAI